jgi:hypothetical protein
MGRDHSCEGCGNGGFNNDEPCECPPSRFILPGTRLPSTCATCGAFLLLDENRETGWRCPREDEHPIRCARDSDWCDGEVCRERGIDCPNAEPIDPHSWVLVDYDDPDEHEVCSRCGSRRNKHGRLTGGGTVPNCEASHA